MPQAIPFIGTAVGYVAGTLTLGQFVATILINVALGALEHRDEDGERWVALDE